MEETYIPGSLRVRGAVIAETTQITTADISNARVQAAAGIEATKLQHQHQVHHSQKAGVDVASETITIHIARGAGTVVGLRIFPTTAPTGGDKKYTVDLQRSTAGGAFASLLTAAEEIDSGNTSRVTVAATLVANPAYIASDALQLVITASGSTGSQGQGLCVELDLREAADA